MQVKQADDVNSPDWFPGATDLLLNGRSQYRPHNRGSRRARVARRCALPAERRPAVLERVPAAAADMIALVLADIAVASIRHLPNRQAQENHLTRLKKITRTP
jgi:hypothetical protein